MATGIQQWEYMEYMDGVNLEKINSFGAEGWEMVGFCHNVWQKTVSPQDDPPIPDSICSFIFYFKRPLK